MGLHPLKCGQNDGTCDQQPCDQCNQVRLQVLLGLCLLLLLRKPSPLLLLAAACCCLLLQTLVLSGRATMQRRVKHLTVQQRCTTSLMQQLVLAASSGISHNTRSLNCQQNSGVHAVYNKQNKILCSMCKLECATMLPCVLSHCFQQRLLWMLVYACRGQGHAPFLITYSNSASKSKGK
jgi:hypothetical protein